MKQINAYLYTEGKVSKSSDKEIEKEDKYLYTRGVYKTSLKKEDLTSDYIEFSSKEINYMIGYVKSSRVMDIKCKITKEKELFKKDYLYISYFEKIKVIKDKCGHIEYKNYDIAISGKDIIPIILAIEKNSNISTEKIKEKITKKINWLKEKYPEEYQKQFGNKDIKDLFEYNNTK